MDKFELVWNMIPAYAYKCYENLKGKEGHYYPSFGQGIYIFIHWNGERYQLFYIGQSEDIGSRLAEHFNHYTSGDPLYYLPKKAEYFDGDIYKLFNDNPSGATKDFSRDLKTLSEVERKEVGTEIMKKTLFAFAKVANVNKDKLLGIEASLQLEALTRHNLKRHGWIGEKTLTRPESPMEIINNGVDERAEKIISIVLPKIIKI